MSTDPKKTSPRPPAIVIAEAKKKSHALFLDLWRKPEEAGSRETRARIVKSIGHGLTECDIFRRGPTDFYASPGRPESGLKDVVETRTIHRQYAFTFAPSEAGKMQIMYAPLKHTRLDPNPDAYQNFVADEESYMDILPINGQEDATLREKIGTSFATKIQSLVERELRASAPASSVVLRRLGLE